MPSHRELRPIELALLVLALPAIARADPAAAEALFREGHRLLEQENYDAACPKLAESQSQDAASGTLINLALCYEKQGKLASAWAQYHLAAALARKDGRPDRVETAEKRLARLEPTVPRLVVRADRLAAGIVVSVGEVRIGAAAFGSAIPIDPGTYEVVVSAVEGAKRTPSTPFRLTR
jgi:tetratricopeptide (TPR) repeat protein